ncbi:hypothetical protein JCGZ_18505 [Jatropha curcas]|uniref:Uncharacterized protein n=1 Tax=Jatropha curcas TaxID=180498 RepID=A0A067K129_JATCU|nr:hypothetical protein JCGZ_18505 [Jatropha curcas]
MLWQSLSSALSSANHEIRVGFELWVATLLADIAVTNGTRRAALFAAGDMKVLEWLLETVAVGVDRCGTQAEAAKALACFILDPNMSANVFCIQSEHPYHLHMLKELEGPVAGSPTKHAYLFKF